MLKKILVLGLLIFNLLSLIYLLTPTPTLSDLPFSVKSEEPGDTVQLKNVAAYYTNLSRTQVINFYQAQYSGLFRIHLNHPPEKAKEIIRDTIQSYYLEEFILPYKESLYINGFEWEKDVFTKPEKRIKNKLLYQGKEYQAKITIRTFPTSTPRRLVSFFFTEFAIILSLYLYRKHV